MNQAAVSSPASVGRGRARANVANDYVTISVAGRFSPPLWMNPAIIVGVFIVPLYCLASWLNHSTYRYFGARADFVTPELFLVGLSGAFFFIAGAMLGQTGPRGAGSALQIRQSKIDNALRVMGWLAIVAYLIFLSALVFQFDLVVQVLLGNRGASNVLQRNLARIPGVTSFMQLSVLGFTLLASLKSVSNYKIPSDIKQIYITLLVFAGLRVLLASERLALIEAAVAVALAPMAFRWRSSLTKSLLPIIGVLGVFILFAIGEYFRSWQYYKLIYGSYFDFVSARFFAYFSTSINNGAGIYSVDSSHNYKMTLEWLWKFPVIGKYFAPPTSGLSYFLNNYATNEFNNPGGLFVPFNDYGFWGGATLWVFFGIVAGVLYKDFARGGIGGLVFYPVFYLGATDLVRIFYWVNTRTFPIFLGGLFLIAYLGSSVRRYRLARDPVVAKARG